MRESSRATLRKRIGAAVLLFQGLAAALWWVALIVEPTLRRFFRPHQPSDTSLLGFWLADAALFVGGSWAAAWLLFRDHPWQRPVLLFTAGGVSYAGLYSLGLFFLAPETGPAAALMGSALLGTSAVVLLTR